MLDRIALRKHGREQELAKENAELFREIDLILDRHRDESHRIEAEHRETIFDLNAQHRREVEELKSQIEISNRELGRLVAVNQRDLMRVQSETAALILAEQQAKHALDHIITHGRVPTE